MALKTQAEMFAPLVAGRYTGQPNTLWRQLVSSWQQDAVLDVTEDSRLVEMPDGSKDLTASLHDAIAEALNSRDWQRLLVLCDKAEEAGVDAELCDLTRKSIRVQYEK